MILTTNLTAVTGSAITAAGAFNAHTITLNVPPGPRYHVIWMKGRAGAAKVMTDLINEIRVKINDKVQRVFTADELNKLNLLFGVEFAAKGAATADATWELPIFFAERWRKSVAAQQGTAWNTGGKSVSSFQIEVDIKAYAGATAGVTTPTFKGEYEEAYFLPNGNEIAADTVPIGFINKVYNTQIASPGGGAAFGDYMLLPTREPISQISIVDYTNFVAFELRINNAVFREDTKAGNDARNIAAGMWPAPTATVTPNSVAADIPTRGMVDIVPDHDDLLTSLIPVFQNGRPINSINLRLMTSTAAGSNIKCIYQTVGRPD